VKKLKIPVVIYRGGIRKIVGHREIRDDGRSLHPLAEIDPELNELKGVPENHISIGYANSEKS
jgi:hypothetical protein